MIRITSFSRKVDIDNGGATSDENCRVLIATNNSTGGFDVNKASFLLTDDEKSKLSDLCSEIEQRIGLVVIADVEPIAETAPQHTADAEAYCPACREYRCKILSPPLNSAATVNS